MAVPRLVGQDKRDHREQEAEHGRAVLAEHDDQVRVLGLAQVAQERRRTAPLVHESR